MLTVIYVVNTKTGKTEECFTRSFKDNKEALTYLYNLQVFFITQNLPLWADDYTTYPESEPKTEQE